MILKFMNSAIASRRSLQNPSGLTSRRRASVIVGAFGVHGKVLPEPSILLGAEDEGAGRPRTGGTNLLGGDFGDYESILWTLSAFA